MSYPSNELTLWSFLRFSALQTSHGLRLHLAVNVCVFFVSLRFVSVVFLLQSSGMSWSGSVAGTFHQAPEPTWYPSLGGATSSSTSSQLELMAGHQESDLSLTLTFVSPFGKSLCVSPACRPAGTSGSQEHPDRRSHRLSTPPFHTAQLTPDHVTPLPSFPPPTM